MIQLQVGLKCADQILEYNGVDLRQATAEQAAYELAKPAEKVTILVQFNLESELDLRLGWYFQTSLVIQLYISSSLICLSFPFQNITLSKTNQVIRIL